MSISLSSTYLWVIVWTSIIPRCRTFPINIQKARLTHANRTPHETIYFFSLRKVRDSNPRYDVMRTPHFECGSFDHSDNFPKSGCKGTVFLRHTQIANRFFHFFMPMKQFSNLPIFQLPNRPVSHQTERHVHHVREVVLTLFGSRYLTCQDIIAYCADYQCLVS